MHGGLNAEELRVHSLALFNTLEIGDRPNYSKKGAKNSDSSHYVPPHIRRSSVSPYITTVADCFVRHDDSTGKAEDAENSKLEVKNAYFLQHQRSETKRI